jgi:hypothetical protein
MQIVFLFALAMLILVLAGVGSNKIHDTTANEAQAAAAHMSVYHTAAVTHCLKVACASGLISSVAIEDSLNDQIASGPLFAKGYFATNYDAPTKTVVTYMKAGFALRGSVNFGTVTAALRDLQDDQTTHVGKWDASARRVVPNYLSGYAVTYTVPTGISAVLPDGAPVIVNRL